MLVTELSGVRIVGLSSCVPKRSEDNLARCVEIYGDEKKAQSIVKATGIRSRRVVDEGTSSLDLCVKAAEKLIDGCAEKSGRSADDVKNDIGAVVQVTFTPERAMPCNACQAQSRLGLSTGIVAFDIGLACSGYAYGLYVAGLLAKSLGKMVLLLDGDAQTPRMDPRDLATVPVLADAGTATLVSPDASAPIWKFAFMTDGAKGEALSLSWGGTIAMDGFAVFKFVTMDVLRFIGEFMNVCGLSPEDVDAFVPHQANVYMIQQIAKRLKFAPDRLWVSGDCLGNSASATVPTTISYCAPERFGEARSLKLLISGFGGGLSASVGLVELEKECLVGHWTFGE